MSSELQSVLSEIRNNLMKELQSQLEKGGEDKAFEAWKTFHNFKRKKPEEFLSVWAVGFDPLSDRLYFLDAADGIVAPFFERQPQIAWLKNLAEGFKAPWDAGSTGYALRCCEALCLPHTGLDPRGAVAIEDFMLGNTTYAAVPVLPTDDESAKAAPVCYICVLSPIATAWTLRDESETHDCFLKGFNRVVSQYRLALRLAVRSTRERQVIKAFEQITKTKVKRGNWNQFLSAFLLDGFLPAPLGVFKGVLYPTGTSPEDRDPSVAISAEYIQHRLGTKMAIEEIKLNTSQKTLNEVDPGAILPLPPSETQWLASEKWFYNAYAKKKIGARFHLWAYMEAETRDHRSLESTLSAFGKSISIALARFDGKKRSRFTDVPPIAVERIRKGFIAAVCGEFCSRLVDAEREKQEIPSWKALTDKFPELHRVNFSSGQNIKGITAAVLFIERIANRYYHLVPSNPPSATENEILNHPRIYYVQRFLVELGEELQGYNYKWLARVLGKDPDSHEIYAWLRGSSVDNNVCSTIAGRAFETELNADALVLSVRDKNKRIASYFKRNSATSFNDLREKGKGLATTTWLPRGDFWLAGFALTDKAAEKVAEQKGRNLQAGGTVDDDNRLGGAYKEERYAKYLWRPGEGDNSDDLKKRTERLVLYRRVSDHPAFDEAYMKSVNADPFDKDQLDLIKGIINLYDMHWQAQSDAEEHAKAQTEKVKVQAEYQSVAHLTGMERDVKRLISDIDTLRARAKSMQQRIAPAVTGLPSRAQELIPLFDQGARLAVHIWTKEGKSIPPDQEWKEEDAEQYKGYLFSLKDLKAAPYDDSLLIMGMVADRVRSPNQRTSTLCPPPDRSDAERLVAPPWVVEGLHKSEDGTRASAVMAVVSAFSFVSDIRVLRKVGGDAQAAFNRAKLLCQRHVAPDYADREKETFASRHAYLYDGQLCATLVEAIIHGGLRAVCKYSDSAKLEITLNDELKSWPQELFVPAEEQEKKVKEDGARSMYCSLMPEGQRPVDLLGPMYQLVSVELRSREEEGEKRKKEHAKLVEVRVESDISVMRTILTCDGKIEHERLHSREDALEGKHGLSSCLYMLASSVGVQRFESRKLSTSERECILKKIAGGLHLLTDENQTLIVFALPKWCPPRKKEGTGV